MVNADTGTAHNTHNQHQRIEVLTLPLSPSPDQSLRLSDCTQKAPFTCTGNAVTPKGNGIVAYTLPGEPGRLYSPAEADAGPVYSAAATPSVPPEEAVLVVTAHTFLVKAVPVPCWILTVTSWLRIWFVMADPGMSSQVAVHLCSNTAWLSAASLTKAEMVLTLLVKSSMSGAMWINFLSTEFTN